MKENISQQVQSGLAPLANSIHELKGEFREHRKEEQEFHAKEAVRLDKHLEIYANNGKEAARLADEVNKMRQQNEEMYALFNGSKFTVFLIKWAFIAFAAVAGLILTIKQIIK